MAGKRNAFLIASFCFYIGHASGQSYLSSLPDNGFYFSFALDCGTLLYPSSHGALDVKIPYTATTADGTTNELFHSTWRVPYYKHNSKSGGTDIKFEFGNHANFFHFRIGGNDYTTTISTGIGHNFYIPINSGFKSTTWVLKPSLSIGVNLSSPSSSNHRYFLGSVDNVNRDINMLGYEFSPTYQSRATRYNPSKTINAETLNIYYAENDITLIPRISLARNNYEKLLCLSLDFAYYLPIHESRKLQMVQDDYGSGKSMGLSNISSLATFNNKSLAGLPAIAQGVYVGVSVGINFSRKTLPMMTGKGTKRTKRVKHSKRDSGGQSTPGEQSVPNSKGF